MTEFKKFSKIIAASIKGLSNEFVTDINGDDLWDLYLKSFPEGSDPVFREKTVHDCNCCKGFVRQVGNMVSISDAGVIKTIWGEAAKSADHPFCVVAEAMDEAVKTAAVAGIFRTEESQYGKEETISKKDGEPTERWNHFHTGPLKRELVASNPGKIRGDFKTTVDVNKRGLEELSPDAVDSVLELIESKSIYRGEEHKAALMEFRKSQKKYNKLGAKKKVAYVWTRSTGPASRFRNTVIGTLVIDLSKGVDLEKAVASFEAKVAPQNYKRTTSLITPGMIKKAMDTIEELGLDPALERRFARIDDISVNDVLWVDSQAAPLMKGGLQGELMKVAASTAKRKEVKEEDAEDISMDDFIEKILPGAKSVEVLFKGSHLGNLMSLTAPVHPDPKQLFMWDNDFAWSYSGNIADSELRKEVQRLGGRVDGVFRFSHSWNHDKRNASLMDLHVFMPGSGVNYSKPGTVNDHYGSEDRVGWNNRKHHSSGGSQDVDYVAAAPAGHVPVENITFPDIGKMKEGKYVCKVHNWSLRQPTQGGFKAEIEFGGEVFEYEYDKAMKNKEWVTVATVTLKKGVFSIEHHIPHGESSQEKWGLTTEEFVKVKTVTLSPNHWGDNEVGNKHAFFVLEGAENDEPTRSIYNEFLHRRLVEHRKVFEIIGEKTKCQPTDGQLSGLGFSSTKKDSIIVKVTGKKQQLFNVLSGV